MTTSNPYAVPETREQRAAVERGIAALLVEFADPTSPYRLGQTSARFTATEDARSNPFSDGTDNFSVIKIVYYTQPLSSAWDELRARSGAHFQYDTLTLRLFVPHRHFYAAAATTSTSCASIVHALIIGLLLALAAQLYTDK